MIAVQTPLSAAAARALHAGDRVNISGVVYTARDAAHKRLIAALEKGEALPLPLEGQVIYYVGPSPAQPGQIIGSAGPTTASRVDPYTPPLLARGLKGMIGKGKRGPEVRAALQTHGAVYFAAVGGAAALIAECIRSVAVIAYDDLGTEAIRRLEVVDFPAMVANDAHGVDVYEQSRQNFGAKGQ
ncbi:MAG: Fe-S-containing hydro-lyase [Anaerolineales bacterium]